MQVWDIQFKQWRDWPVREMWEVEWYEPPTKPAKLSDEDWELQLECGAADMCPSHSRYYASERVAKQQARRILNTRPNYWGVVTVVRLVPTLIEAGVMEWDTAGDRIDVS
jgi:hypothetical protein